MIENDAELFAIIGAGISIACCLEATARILEGKDKVSKKRSCWIKERINTVDDGNTHELIQEHNLYKDPNKFLYMDEQCFRDILKFIKKDIQKMNTHMRRCIPTEQKLAATLRYLATGDTSKSISKKTNVSISFLSQAISDTCDAIYRNMSDKYLQFPTKRRYELIANNFEEWSQFPNCVGALGTKHIQFNASKKTSKLYLNSQGFNSVVLLAVADIFGKFLFINVSGKGHMNDYEVFERCELKGVLKNSDDFLPEPVKVEDGRNMPFVFVADNDFPNTERILTPYQCDLTVDKEIFNERLLHAREGIRKAFDVLTTRFGVLNSKVMRDDIRTANIIKTCCVLHNFLMENNPWYMENVNSTQSTLTMEKNVESSLTNIEAEEIRRMFKEYICNNTELERHSVSVERLENDKSLYSTIDPIEEEFREFFE